MADYRVAIAPLQRLAVVVSSLILAAAVHFTHEYYLFPVWGGDEFAFYRPQVWQYIYAFGSIITLSCIAPIRIRLLADVVLVPFYSVVYIPTIVITLAIVADPAPYIPSLSAFSFSLFIAFLASNRGGEPVGKTLPARWAIRAVLIVWAIGTFLLFIQYRTQIRFVGIYETYEQRLVSHGTVGTTLGYLQTYYLGMINPLLLAAGLVARSKLLVVISIIGFLLVYGIDAQKAALAIPMGIVCAHIALRWMPKIALSTVTILFLISLALIACVGLGTGSAIASIFAVRTIGIPAQTFTQYHDYFSDFGFTWWSNVRGIGLLSPVSEYARHLDWPVLGRLTGEHYYPQRGVNLNANFFASDGIAAAGAIGIYVIGTIFAAFVFALNRLSRSWDHCFVIPALLPLTFSFLNASLFTTLLSFGGFAWLLFLQYCGDKTPARIHRGSSSLFQSAPADLGRPRTLSPIE